MGRKLNFGTLLAFAIKFHETPRTLEIAAKLNLHDSSCVSLPHAGVPIQDIKDHLALLAGHVFHHFRLNVVTNVIIVVNEAAGGESCVWERRGVARGNCIILDVDVVSHICGDCVGGSCDDPVDEICLFR